MSKRVCHYHTAVIHDPWDIAAELLAMTVEEGSCSPHLRASMPKNEDFAFFFQYRVRRSIHNRRFANT
jgi:hypothetical protein